jgi:hypothetical protein
MSEDSVVACDFIDETIARDRQVPYTLHSERGTEDLTSTVPFDLTDSCSGGSLLGVSAPLTGCRCGFRMVSGGMAGGLPDPATHCNDRCCEASLGGRAMSVARRIFLFIAAVGLLVTVAAPTASAHDRRGPAVTPLASFGNGTFVTGSTIGPDGALYVTDGSAGSVLRIDRRSGRVTTYAMGLPTKAFATDIGGPVDVVFVGRTAYVLVTLVSGEIDGEPFGDASDKNGIYRLERDGSFTLVADIGGWSVDNPPVPAFFVDTGVQYAMERYHGGFLVTDGHHNRVLLVKRDGSINEVATFGNVVPTGLEVSEERLFITQLGPISHEPEDGKVLALHRRSSPTEIASGASMLIDVERGPRGKLYALSQGQWNGVGEGSPALPNTGRLVIVERDGSLTPVVDRHGQELVLDRPTSMEFVGNTAYVVSVDGNVYKIANL